MSASAFKGLTVQEAARLLSVSRPTVYRMIEKGVLPAEVHPVTGRKRISRTAVERLAQGRGDVEIGRSGMVLRRVRPDTLSADLDPPEFDESGAEIARTIYDLPKLRFHTTITDLAERIDYYRFHGPPDE